MNFLSFIDKYINNKISENEEYIRITFYDIRIKNNLNEEEEKEFLKLARNKLENSGYDVYFTGAKFTYKETKMTVQDNELMIAIKE